MRTSLIITASGLLAALSLAAPLPTEKAPETNKLEAAPKTGSLSKVVDSYYEKRDTADDALALVDGLVATVSSASSSTDSSSSESSSGESSSSAKRSSPLDSLTAALGDKKAQQKSSSSAAKRGNPLDTVTSDLGDKKSQQERRVVPVILGAVAGHNKLEVPVSGHVGVAGVI